MTTFILAKDRPEAIAWCYRWGRQPYARNTVIVTTVAGTRGIEYRDGDEVVALEASQAVLDAWEICMLNWRMKESHEESLLVDDELPGMWSRSDFTGGAQ